MAAGQIQQGSNDNGNDFCLCHPPSAFRKKLQQIHSPLHPLLPPYHSPILVLLSSVTRLSCDTNGTLAFTAESSLLASLTASTFQPDTRFTFL